jgi:hypothetical protein
MKKEKKIDTIVIVDGKPMWKKDYKLLQENQKNIIKKYFAIIAPSKIFDYGRIVENTIYILSVEYNFNEIQPYRFYTNSCFINDSNFVSKEKLYEFLREHDAYNYELCEWYLTKTKSSDYFIGNEAQEFISFKEENGFCFIDMEQTVINLNRRFPKTILTIEETYIDNEFQYEHRDISHYNMIKAAGYGGDGEPNEEWDYYLESDVCNYLVSLNSKIQNTKNTKRKPKEYKLVEIE